jgi:hypothetical protein
VPLLQDPLQGQSLAPILVATPVLNHHCWIRWPYLVEGRVEGVSVAKEKVRPVYSWGCTKDRNRSQAVMPIIEPAHFAVMTQNLESYGPALLDSYCYYGYSFPLLSHARVTSQLLCHLPRDSAANSSNSAACNPCIWLINLSGLQRVYWNDLQVCISWFIYTAFALLCVGD